MKLLLATFTLLLSFLFTTNHAFAYTVQKGDTLTDIASKSNLTLQELAEFNPQIQNLNLIYEGETINTEAPKKIAKPSKMISYFDYDIDLLGRLIRTEAIPEELAELNLPIKYLNADVTVNNEEPKKALNSAKIANYSDYEKDLLARLVRAEAQTESFAGKVAVACVVLNRLESSHFPNTIKEVIYQRKQFQPVSNGEINKPADLDSIEAVNAALTEQRQTALDSLFFYNPDIATSRWLDSRTTTLAIGQHVFKK